MRGVGHRAQLSLCTTTSVTLLSLTELTTQGSTVLCLTTLCYLALHSGFFCTLFLGMPT